MAPIRGVDEPFSRAGVGVQGGARDPVQIAVEPVYVVPYDPRWSTLFEQERARIEAAIQPWVVAVEHIGSTAVPRLDAKPVIDVMAGLQTPGMPPVASNPSVTSVSPTWPTTCCRTVCCSS